MNLDWFYPLRWTAVKLLRLVTLLAQAPEEIATPTLQLTHSSSQPLPLDVYLPSTQSTDPLPIHINLHGSGFCHNTFGLDAPFCRFLADSTPRIVVDADYRKAPEHSWPTPVEDVRSADARVRELAAERGWDGRRISLGGFSSGGTLALIEAARAGKAGEEIAAVVVFCPSTNLFESPYDKPQLSPNPDAAGISFPPYLRHLLYSCYVPAGIDRTNPLVSPFFAAAEYFPPSVTIITCEKDSLAREAKALGEKIKKEGKGKKDVVLWEAEGQGHGWNLLTKKGTEPNRLKLEAYALARDRLRLAFGIAPSPPP